MMKTPAILDNGEYAAWTTEGTSGPEIGPKFFLKLFDPRFRKSAFILLYAVMALSFWRYTEPAPSLLDQRVIANLSSSYVDKQGGSRPPFSWTSIDGWKCFLQGEKRTLKAFILMGILPLVFVKLLFREKLSDYGISWGNRFTIRSILLFSPFFIFLGWMTSVDPRFALIYPCNPMASGSPSVMLIHSIFLFFLYYFAWEFFFRGFMIYGLIPSCGLINAVLISTLTSAMLHFGHPLIEVFGAVGGGLFWGLLARRTESIVPVIVQHALMGIALNYFIVF